MKINCQECGELVIEGKVEWATKKDGGRRKIFTSKREIIGHKDYGVFGKIYVYEPVFLHGEIHRNNSNDPNKWSGLCSGCQSKGVGA